MSRRSYTKEEHQFILDNYKNHSVKSLHKAFNEKFSNQRAYGAIKCYLQNRKIYAGKKDYNVKYSDEIIEFVRNNVKKYSDREIADMVEEKFKISTNAQGISNIKAKNGIRSGVRRGTFPKGHVPANKGKTWDEYMSPEGQKNALKTTFKKGQKPQNYKPIGSERICSKDGYIIVKVQDEGNGNERWRPKHRVIWEEEYGPIPDGHVVTFLDGNKLNFEPDNLALISQGQNAILNKSELRVEGSAELTELGVNLSSLIEKIHKEKEGKSELK